MSEFHISTNPYERKEPDVCRYFGIRIYYYYQIESSYYKRLIKKNKKIDEDEVMKSKIVYYEYKDKKECIY